ncbi:H+transporting two-sector ATPase C subunit [Deinococcus proteolyticus MRP]|uniref:H+transporting two-sector ATPase C subunit n=1 Tax=Deinococcus proteolyticus (strain ATCC 35074 / DSM 20540 / JCM 6276 / NBRC 101906 / NCIMB 13154 / VKM Ac-1939 / CCM 2703 / MRP) TaxID=693977 RepID=F0RIZ3_DEIPM|nr:MULTISPECIES: ATP synthase subunit K [Deinococcus]ADY25401.1 H+transporting two-sector ATPase C subunit [Deinococcus proteolyticus MRP]MCY1701525.1 V-type ATP synthase subunit K [Deinococcus sp. SL84]MDO4263005.1 V-type ATP synthase subunit K [Deinococcus sp.]
MTKYNKIAIVAVLFALAGAANAQEVAATAGNNEGLSAIGKGLALGLGAVGTGLAQARIGSSLVGAVAEDPSKFGQLLLVFLLPETLVILGFVGLFLI